MKFLRKILDDVHPQFVRGGKFEKFYPLYEALDTFAYTPGEVAHGTTHVRDGLDLKRLMVTVAVALIPAVLMACYNTGFQANSVYAAKGLTSFDDWRFGILQAMGIGLDPNNMMACFIHGLLYFLPAYIVTMAAGGICEAIFASVRGHEINEGFVVTGLLFPLTLPPTIPLWQVAVGIIFGVVIGKEVFGGTGKNFLNPALTARAFLFFAYPAEISGDLVWTAIPEATRNAIDGYSGATSLGLAAAGGVKAITVSWTDAFFGFVKGSMGETSALASLIGAVILVVSGVGSWRTMLGVAIGSLVMVKILNAVGSDTNLLMAMSFKWHIVLGGYMFGLVFMATDPVSSAQTLKGQWIYGALIGVMVILVRVVNPAYPEGMMLAILFGNLFAPLIDYYVVKANITRRELRNGRKFS